MCFILEEENAMFTGDNVLGSGTSVVEDLGVFMASLRRMQEQHCRRGYPAHGSLIGDLDGKIAGELAGKIRREQQVLQVLTKCRTRGVRSLDIHDIVSDIYGGSIDQNTRALALEPFIQEVLRKLAGDRQVAFEKKDGKQCWFLLESRRSHTTSRGSPMSTALAQVQYVDCGKRRKYVFGKV